MSFITLLSPRENKVPNITRIYGNSMSAYEHARESGKKYSDEEIIAKAKSILRMAK